MTTTPIRARLAVLLLLAAATASCAGDPPASPSQVGGPAATAATSSAPSPSRSSASSPSATPPPVAASPVAASPPVAVATGGMPAVSAASAKACAASTLASMTEAQRIGQLFSISLPGAILDDRHRAAIAAWHFGSVWYGRSTAGVTALRSVSDAVQALATRATTARVPFLIAANQEGGLVQGLSGTGFATIPSAIDQGRMSTAALQAAAKTWARELRAAGVNLDFAPVADVVPPHGDAANAPIGELHREYGHHPAVVADHVAAFIDGMRAAGVATTAKHFPGLGRVTANTDDAADVTDAITTAHDPYLRPFARAIDDGVPFVMVSLATYERIDRSSIAAFSSTVVHGLLRTTLGFHGVVASDSLTAAAVRAVPPRERAVRFLEAGGDLIVLGKLAPAIAMAQGSRDRGGRGSGDREAGRCRRAPRPPSEGGRRRAALRGLGPAVERCQDLGDDGVRVRRRRPRPGHRAAARGPRAGCRAATPA